MNRIGAGVVVLALLTSGCGQKTPALTEQENKVVTEMTTDLKTRCVGRYLIDLPGNVVSLGSATLQGVAGESRPKTLEQFEHDMDARETELKTTKSPAGYQFLYDDGNVRGIEHTRYFVSLGNPFSSSDAVRVIEAYKWDRGYQIKLNIDGTDLLHSEDKDQPWVKEITTPNDVPEKTRHVFDLIEKLEGRSEDTIPTQPGTCFFGGFLPGKAVSKDEEIQSYFMPAGKPDVGFSFESFGNLVPGDTLLKRIRGEEMREALKAADGRILRSGSVDLAGGMKAEESLLAALTVEKPPVHGYRFSLEANYGGGAITPYLLLDMDTGAANFFTERASIKAPSLTEGEAVALWDAVSRTLRPRPNAF